MNDVYLLTGGNMGDRIHFLEAAAEKISTACGPIVRASSVYETAAWGKEDQASFLNQVLQIQTVLQPVALLQQILKIEEELGRKRELRYGPRIIDIDILFYNDAIISETGLHVPHPQIQNRRFVLAPLTEIAPRKMHPLLAKTVTQLLEECKDPLPVNKFY